MGEKYLKRYRKYFRDPEIREFDMQHEQWLFGGEQYTAPVLQAIDEFMALAEDGWAIEIDAGLYQSCDREFNGFGRSRSL